METEQAEVKFAGNWYMRGLTPFSSIHAIGSECNTEFKCFDKNREFIESLWGNNIDIVVIETQALQVDREIIRFIRKGLKAIPLVGLYDREDVDRCELIKAGMDYVINASKQDEISIVIARCLDRAAPIVDEPKVKLSIRGWELDMIRGELFRPDGGICKLTSIERDFLKLIFRSEGRECSFEYLAAGLGIGPDEPYRHRLEVVVFRLRQKFKRQFAKEIPLYSIRGFGYVFSPEPAKGTIRHRRPRLSIMK